MKIWMSGEIQSDIAAGHRNARKEVEGAFNAFFAERDFGAGLIELAFITIIRNLDSADYGEIRQYSRRRRTAEFRLKISHEVFLKADDRGQVRLLAASVLRAVSLLRELKIKDFDYVAFEIEVSLLSGQQGWT